MKPRMARISRMIVLWMIYDGDTDVTENGREVDRKIRVSSVFHPWQKPLLVTAIGRAVFDPRLFLIRAIREIRGGLTAFWPEPLAALALSSSDSHPSRGKSRPDRGRLSIDAAGRVIPLFFRYDLYVTCGDKVYRRKVNAKGVIPWKPAVKPPRPRL